MNNKYELSNVILQIRRQAKKQERKNYRPTNQTPCNRFLPQKFQLGTFLGKLKIETKPNKKLSSLFGWKGGG